MQLKVRRVIMALAIMLAASVSFASPSDGEGEKFDASSFIMGHIADSHTYHMGDYNGHAISVPLPVILWTGKGPVAFMSSAFHHDEAGKVQVNRAGQSFIIYEDKIYYAGQPGPDGSYIEKDTDGKILNKAPLDFSITKNVAQLIIAMIVMLWLFISVGRFYRKPENADKVPTGAARVVEPLVVFVRDEIAVPNLGERNARRFMPYLMTIFCFILINNLFGLIPFFPFGTNVSGNIAFTLVLGICTFIMVQLSGSKEYWKEVFAPHVPKWLWVLMIPIEFIGLFTKPFSLIIRLFANITAGHIIVLSLVCVIFIMKEWIYVPLSGGFVIFMTFIELLVAAIQAYIFTLLSALYLGLATVTEEAAEEGVYEGGEA